MPNTIRQQLKEIISKHVPGVSFDILTPPDQQLGDYSTNMAFKVGGNPITAAGEIKSKLDKDQKLTEICSETNIVAPGFINFKLNDELLHKSLEEILSMGDEFGSFQPSNKKINLEFVSANPTGPPTVGNARAAAYGDTLGNIFKKAGHQVTKEYYLNDTGVQVNKLGLSVAKRYLELQGKEVEFEEGLYQGEYIKDIAKELESEIKSKNLDNIEALTEFCRNKAIEMMINKAKETMNKVGVDFDVWFRESELYKNLEINDALERLKKIGAVEDKDNATWFKYDGNKEAVLIKSDGNKTYLMGDIAYTLNKLEKRKFDKAINIWGTDHHGDVPRLLAAAKVLGHKDGLEIVLHQLVMLKKQDEKLKISKRAGNLVLLEDLIQDVGKDPVRFFFLSKDLNTHMEFDIDVAKEHSKKNPVFYIQYAFARLSSIFDKLKSKNEKIKTTTENLKFLNQEEEFMLMRTLVKFPDIIENVAKTYQVHHLATYALELANQFHHFYEAHKVIQDDKNLQDARLHLSQAVYFVLKNCLNLMGLDAPQKM